MVGHRDLHGAVEGQFALVNAAQDAKRRLHDVIAFQHLGAELRPGHFDSLGQGDFLLPLQQGDFTHLGQIHPDRIVRPRFAIFSGEKIFGW